jgi:multidrug transporter EmrE-like cation transporter
MLLATGLGVVLFGEEVSLVSALGVGMVIAGVGILSFDPEEK